MQHEISQIVILIIAALYGVTAIYYFSAGLLFSRLLFKLGALFSGKNILTLNSDEAIQDMGYEILPVVNPVLSSVIDNAPKLFDANILKGYIITFIGLLLGAIAVLFGMNNFWGFMGVAFFSVMEVLLGIFFYLPRDSKSVPPDNSGMKHIVIHGIIGGLATAAYFLL